MANLPPGVTESMIPGNRPEDLAFDDFVEELAEHIEHDEFPFVLEAIKALMPVIRAEVKRSIAEAAQGDDEYISWLEAENA